VFSGGRQNICESIHHQKFWTRNNTPGSDFVQKNIPIKGHCTCPIGKCGVCCHIIALLMFLEHYNKTKTTNFALSCTEKLQKWHRNGAGAGVATKTSHISLRSFRNTRSTREPRKLNREKKMKERNERLTLITSIKVIIINEILTWCLQK